MCYYDTYSRDNNKCMIYYDTYGRYWVGSEI